MAKKPIPTAAQDPRPEHVWIRKRILASLKGARVSILPATVDLLVSAAWDIVQTERETSALIVAAVHDQYGPLDDDMIGRLGHLLQDREEHESGRVTVAGFEVPVKR